MDGSRVLAEELAEAARALHVPQGEQVTLEAAVREALTIVRGCTAAGLSEVGADGRLRTTAATGELVLLGDRLQHDLDEGPCVSAIREQTVVWSPDLTREPRWQRWATAAHDQLGVRSMLSLQLYSGEGGHGALNLYATEKDAFDAYDQAAAVALSAQIAVAVATARRDEQLSQAVRNRTVIGQAQGILMERFDLSPDAAFAVLVRTSQGGNTKLYLVAEELVRTRSLPGQPRRSPRAAATTDVG